MSTGALLLITQRSRETREKLIEKGFSSIYPGPQTDAPTSGSLNLKGVQKQQTKHH